MDGGQLEFELVRKPDQLIKIDQLIRMAVGLEVAAKEIGERLPLKVVREVGRVGLAGCAPRVLLVAQLGRLTKGVAEVPRLVKSRVAVKSVNILAGGHLGVLCVTGKGQGGQRGARAREYQRFKRTRQWPVRLIPPFSSMTNGGSTCDIEDEHVKVRNITASR